ncbi:m7 diphosphatase [Nannochloropsis oceanica]
MPPAASHLGLLILASVLLSVKAMSWKRRRIGGKWAATNLKHLKDFVVEEVLSSNEVTPSPDGFTVFLGHFTWQGPEEKALIKLRPQQLPATDKIDTTAATTAAAATKTPRSLRCLLRYIGLRVDLESGAEYGYYHGSISPLKLTLLRVPLAYHIEVIAPASPRQIIRARVEERILVRETPELYQQVLGGFLLVPDPKWKSHPNPSDTPKEEWRHHSCTAGLACLAIVHDRDIGSLRDLRRKHVPLLKNVLEKGLKAIEKVYGVGPEEIRVFVHYVPQFFHFHVHFSRLSLAHGIEVERAHLLSDIIDKIENAPPGQEYYEKACISYTVKKSEEIFKRLQRGPGK